MVRIRERICYADEKSDLADYKALVRGAAEDAFWNEDELIDYRPSSKRKKHAKGSGCPGNDGNAHVYIWVPHDWDKEYDYPWYGGYEVKACCGCGKRINKMRRLTE